MSISRKLLVFTLALGLFCRAAARAEDKPTVANAAPAASSASNSATAADESATLANLSESSAMTASLASPQTTATTTTAGSPSSFGSSDNELHDNQWHIYGTAYLWVPSMHGSIGVRGYDTNLRVTTGDIFSNFRGGFLGVFTPTYN